MQPIYSAITIIVCLIFLWILFHLVTIIGAIVVGLAIGAAIIYGLAQPPKKKDPPAQKVSGSDLDELEELIRKEQTTPLQSPHPDR